MSNSKDNTIENDDLSLFLCYNCGIEIIDKNQKYCPNCNVILNPNDYISWKRSWWSFLCLICVIPVLIGLLFILI